MEEEKMDTSTPQGTRNTSDTSEAELSLGNVKAKRNPNKDKKAEEKKARHRERQREVRALQKASSSASTSKQLSPSICLASNETAGDVFVTPKSTIRRSKQAVKVESESDIQSERSQETPEGKRMKIKLTPEEKKRRAAERTRLNREQETEEQKAERQRRDRESHKAKRAIQKAARGGFSTEHEMDVSSVCSSRDPSEDRFFVPQIAQEELSERPETPTSKSRKEAERKQAERKQETPEQKAERQRKDAERKRISLQNESDVMREERLADQRERFIAQKTNETPEQKRARQDANRQVKETSRAAETEEQHVARIDAVIDRKNEREKDEDVAAQRREREASNRRESRAKLRDAPSSDSEDGEDHIQDPVTIDPLDIGERKTCPFCGAKIYGKDYYCCDRGKNRIYPEKRLPDPMDELIYGYGPDAKELKKNILSYSSGFGMASLQRKNEEVAKHGLPVAKVKGSIDAYPSAAFPFGRNQEAFGNIYVYDGKEAAEMRMKYGHNLDRKIVERLQSVLDKWNKMGRQYKNMKEVMSDLNPNEEPSAVRLKIINAWQIDKSKLQGHQGIYKKDNEGSPDFIAVFYKASVEQGDIELPGLIVYPYRSRKPMMPIPYWSPLVEPLCYVLLRPYGEYGFVPKRFPRNNEKVNYWRWLAEWCVANPEQARKSELKMTRQEILAKAQMLEDVPPEYVIDEGVVDMDYEDYRNYEDRDSQQENEEERENVNAVPVSENGEESPVVERRRRQKIMEGHRIAKDFDAERAIEEIEEPEDDAGQGEDGSASETESVEEEGLENVQEQEIIDSLGQLLNEENPQDENIPQGYSDQSSDDGSDGDDEGRGKKSQKRKFSSHREYLVYIYQEREHLENRYINSGKLGQLFLIHSLTRILRGRAEKYRQFNTMKIKTTKMKFLRAMERKAEKKGYKLGVATLMPRNVAGSPRWLQSKFENAVALANRLGKIDLFITATCNVNWPEIKNNLKSGQTWADNPFLVNNVFYEKWKKLKDLLLGKKNAVGKRPGGIFGKHRWYSGSIEFQSRGPPHIHLVVSLKHHIKTTAQIDKVCQAAFPRIDKDPVLRKLVEEFMVHSPCDKNPQAYCREGLKNKKRPQCKKNFPKEFNDTTKFGDRTYPDLKRPEDFQTSSKNKDADNRWIVPYNGTLLSAWRGHLNIEVVSTVKVVKYIFKYIFKGFDRVLVETIANSDGLDTSGMTIDGHLVYPKGLRIPPGELERRKRAAIKTLTDQGVDLTDKNGKPTLVYDETVIIQDMRVLTSCEAAWILVKYPRHLCSHTVIYESVHEEDQEPLLYKEEDEEKMKEKIEKTGFPSKLKAWFRLNQEDEEARDLTFQEIPYFYTFRNGKWARKKRVNRHLIARIQSVPPRRREAFAIRLLCQSRKGITSFKDLRTVNGITYDTFTQAAKALGIMNDQQEWTDCMAEAASSVSPSQLRRLFMQILTNNVVLDPLSIYNTHRQDFWDNRNWSDQMKEAHALYHMRSYLSAQGMTLANFNLPDVVESDLPAEKDLDDDSGRRRFDVSQAFADKLRAGLQDEQADTFDEIFPVIEKGNRYDRNPDDKNVFFLQGSGGVGKTVLMKALYYSLLAAGKNVACVAHTGIAASLLPGGQTAHRFFHIPLLQDDTMNCQVELESAEADYLRQFDCIIWDEATMTDTRIYDAVHRLMHKLHQVNDTDPFGGTFLVLAGDWKQTLPIDPEARSVGIVDRTLLRWRERNWIKYFQLTKNRRTEDPAYAAYLEKVGLALSNIQRGKGRPEDEMVELPQNSMVYSEREVIQKVFGDKGSPEEKFDSFKDAAIMAVDNKTTFDINKIALKRLLDTPEHVFRSIDTHDETTGLYALDPECYHQQTPPGMPPHELKLKVGAPVILLRNISVALGLTNGTRLIVTKIGNQVIHVKHVHPRKNHYRSRIDGDDEEEEDIILGKMLFASNKPASRELSFTRKQFPLRLAFSITVNRAQGQTLERAGLILRTPCFSHGQLYVALSRVRTPSKLFIYNCDHTNLTNNVVYPQVIKGLETALARSKKRSHVPSPVDDEAMDTSSPPVVDDDIVEDWHPKAVDRRDRTRQQNFPKKNSAAKLADPRDWVLDAAAVDAELERMHQELMKIMEEDERRLETAIELMDTDTPPDYVVEIPREDPKSKNKPSGSRRKPIPPGREENVLLLENSRFFCFANAAIQVLHHLFEKEIMNPRERNPVMKEIRDIITTKHKTKDLLAMAKGRTGENFADEEEQHDAEEYLRYLLEFKLPQRLGDSMKFQLDFVDTCIKCKKTSSRSDKNIDQLVASAEKGKNFNYYLRSCENEGIDKKCTVCKVEQQPHRSMATLVNSENLRFIRLIFSRLLHPDDPDSVIERNMQPPMDVEAAFGYLWKPTMMVEYTLLSNQIRHYTVYLKNSRGWLHISDDQQRQLYGPPDMSTISMVILEKLGKEKERMREPAPIPRSIPQVVRTIREKVIPTAPKQKPISTLIIPDPIVQSSQPMKKRFFIYHGDLLDKELQADIVVNAANPGLRCGDGVCGAIFKKAGKDDLEKECKKKAKTLPGGVLSPGQAVITDSYGMKPRVKYIVHTAAPDMRIRKKGRDAELDLRMSYINSCIRANEKKGKRVVFPILGIGIYGYDQRQGIAVAIQSAFTYFEAYPQSGIQSVILAIKGNNTYEQAKTLMRAITNIGFATNEATQLRQTFENYYDNRSRPQEIRIPGTSIHVASFVSSLKNKSQFD